jgi:hypothetical protein
MRNRDPRVDVARERERRKWRRAMRAGVPVARREGGTSRSSDETSVIEVERRGRVVGCRSAINQRWEESDGRDEISEQAV